MEKLILVCMLIGMVWNKTPEYEDCGGTGKVVALDVIPCDDPEECVFTRGQKATLSMVFEPAKNHEAVVADVKGKVFGVEVPFPLGTCSDACKCGVTCPTVVGKQYNFTTTLDVKSGYPAIPVVVDLKLKDSQSKADIVCVKFPLGKGVYDKNAEIRFAKPQRTSILVQDAN